MDRFLLLSIAAILIFVVLSAMIYMLQRMRAGGRTRARRGAAARRRVENAVERADMAASSIQVPDRFGALGVEGPVQLTAEPQPGDLSATLVSPQPPFDLTSPAAREALDDWESAPAGRRRTIMLRGYLSHPLPRVRAEALDLLGTLGSEDARLPHHLALLLRDDSDTVRAKAAGKAWTGGVDVVVEALRADDDPEAAARAHAELERHAPAGREVPSLH